MILEKIKKENKKTLKDKMDEFLGKKLTFKIVDIHLFNENLRNSIKHLLQQIKLKNQKNNEETWVFQNFQEGKHKNLTDDGLVDLILNDYKKHSLTKNPEKFKFTFKDLNLFSISFIEKEKIDFTPNVVNCKLEEEINDKISKINGNVNLKSLKI